MMNHIRHNSPSPIQCQRAFTYCSSLIYFSVATVTITTKHQKYYFCYCYFCYHYHYYHITLLLNTLLQILSYPDVVELTTQLLILENILWLPLCQINKFGLYLTLESCCDPLHLWVIKTNFWRRCQGA